MHWKPVWVTRSQSSRICLLPASQGNIRKALKEKKLEAPRIPGITDQFDCSNFDECDEDDLDEDKAYIDDPARWDKL